MVEDKIDWNDFGCYYKNEHENCWNCDDVNCKAPFSCHPNYAGDEEDCPNVMHCKDCCDCEEDKEILMNHNKRLFGEIKNEKIVLTVNYLSDEQWKIFMEMEMNNFKRKRDWWMRFKLKHFIKAWSYTGDNLIYMKESSKGDMKLLLHEMGHAVGGLEHSWKPGIMNAVWWMRWF